ncbi:hypothetical protein [Fluviispira multicolorata]|uniref:Uncharacterized protein n=1 Tax=Fluviispira multicolorata TaxID=2654512 RepID=A0A833JEQ6_9BACT|nr:hypothetical protein [Fluviispira multicolorata]KAB8033334.1 hypothetical protein GCL57_01145 [Fluviispira multicolorata]
MRKRAIVILSAFVLLCTLYCISMLYAQIQISIGLDKSIKNFKNRPSYPEQIEFSRISLSPFFFINKTFYIKDIVIHSKYHFLNIYIKSLCVSNYIKNGPDILPMNFETNSITFFSLNNLKESLQRTHKQFPISKETIDSILDKSILSLKGEYNKEIYEIETSLSKGKIKLMESYLTINQFPLNETKYPLKFFIKKMKINLEDIAISLKENIKKNPALKDLLGNKVDTIYTDLELNFDKSIENNYELKIKLLIHKILHLNINTSFLIEEIFHSENYKLNNMFILLEDLNFINNYFWRKSLENNISYDEEKRKAIKQNNMMLIFIEKTPLEHGLLEFNRFIENPKYFFISITPKKPIPLQEIQTKSRENIFNLFREVNINFKAIKNKSYLEKAVKETDP